MKRDEDVGSARTAAADIASSETVASEGPSVRGAGAYSPDTLSVVAPSVYIQLDEFARGGLGRIIRAKDTRTGRIVAIKEMLSSTEDAALRFAREAMITANLQHPAIVPVYEVGRWTSGQPFYAMKLVSGRPLDQVIASTKTIDDRLALVSHVLAVADALAYAHGEHVIHRDLKPHNVLVGAFGETVVIDWGLARKLDETDPSASAHRVISAVPGQTHIGAVMGTPAYMPPEQASGKRVDERADVYAIGAILYHVLAGKPPYSGKTLDELLTKVKAGAIERLVDVDPSIPADLAAIVERAMAREPVDRYSSAAELADDLRRFTTGQLVQAHQYTRMQRIARFVGRNRAAVAIATIAVVAGAVGGAIAVTNVMTARDEATNAQARAEVARDTARTRLVEAHIDRARAELAAGHDDLALAFTVAAAEMNGLDDRLRFIAARALASHPEVTRLDEKNVSNVFSLPESHDVLLSLKDGLMRWDPVHARVVWRHRDKFAGDVIALDSKTVLVTREHSLDVVDVDSGKVTSQLTIPDRRFKGSMIVDPTRRWLTAPLFEGAMAVFDLSTRSLASVTPSKVSVESPPLVSLDGQRLVAPVRTKDDHRLIQLVDRSGNVIAELCSKCTIARYLGPHILVIEQADRLPVRMRIVDWNGAVVRELYGATSGDVAEALTFANGSRLVLAFLDGTLAAYESDGSLLWRRPSDIRATTAIIDSQQRLWVTSQLAFTMALDAVTGMPLGRYTVGGLGIAVSDDGMRVTSIRGGVGAASLAANVDVQTFAPSPARVRRFVFLGADRFLTGSEDGVVMLFERGKPGRELYRHEARVQSLAVVDGRRVVSSGHDGVTRIFDLTSGTEVARVPLGPFGVASPDGTSIAIGTSKGELYLWNGTQPPTPLTRKPTMRTDSGVSPIRSVRWNHDGTFVGAVDESGALDVWTKDGVARLRVPAIGPEKGLDLAFSRNGTWVARTGEISPRTLYSLVPGVAPVSLGQAGGEPYDMMYAFTADDSRVALSSAEGVFIWDLPAGTLRHTIPLTYSFWPTFSQNNAYLFTGGLDRSAHVFDTRSGLEVTSVAAPSEVYSLVLAPDGHRLAILTLGAAMVWNLTPYDKDLAELQRSARCRIAVAVVDGAIIQRPIDTAACNAQR